MMGIRPRWLTGVLLAACMLPALDVFADKVYLKNGRSFECIVETETAAAYDLDIGFGKTRLSAAEVARVERYSDQENAALRAFWQDKKSRDQKAQQQRLEQERQRRLAEQQALERAPRKVKAGQSRGGSIVVEALLNNKVKANLVVDSGAGMVVVSKAIAAQLGVSVPESAKLAKKDETIIQSVVADGRTVEAKLFTLESVQVQDAKAANVAAAVILVESGIQDVDGLLGMSFLTNFKFSLDAKEGVLTLEKNR